MTNCLLYFRVSMQTSFSERVIIVGSSKHLGQWDPRKGLELNTSPLDYPQWFNAHPIRLPKGSVLDFKLIVMHGEEIVRWESLSGNRRYLIRHEKAILRCFEGKFEGEELLHRSSIGGRRSRLLSQEKGRKRDFEALNSEVFLPFFSHKKPFKVRFQPKFQ